MKVGNFNQSYTDSALNTELYFDGANCGHELLKKNEKQVLRSRRDAWGLPNDSGQYRYDFSIIPVFGFLGGSLPLAKNVELKLSFDRAIGKMGVIKMDAAAGETTAFDKPLAITNCHAVTEWISSPAIRSYFEDIDINPIVYEYEDIEVVIRSLEKNDKNLRVEAVKGGNLPTFLFAGIIPQSALAGNLDECSTEFTQQNVVRFNLTIDGQSVNGYPLEVANHSRVYPLVKFLDTTSRLANVAASKTQSVETFKHNYLWSHKFEVEKSSSGWIGLDFKLTEGYSDNMYIVIWLISSCALTIDKHNQIEHVRVC